MHLHRTSLLILALGLQAALPGHAQDTGAGSVSSDDITVADGLQLPIYGRVWSLDTWKGVQELVQLGSAETTTGGFSLRPRHLLEVKGEAAKVRLHEAMPALFLRMPAGLPTSASSPFAIVRLITIGQNRQITKAAADDLIREGKGTAPRTEDLIELNQKRVGTTDWYRMSPQVPLTPDEYAIVPLPRSQGTSASEIYDFAIDPQAPENAKALHSERDRQVE